VRVARERGESMEDTPPLCICMFFIHKIIIINVSFISNVATRLCNSVTALTARAAGGYCRTLTAVVAVVQYRGPRQPVRLSWLSRGRLSIDYGSSVATRPVAAWGPNSGRKCF
jgi:hypothetical protein